MNTPIPDASIVLEPPSFEFEGYSTDLTPTQQLAMEWLTTGGSVTEAAQFAGVCRQTVSEWLHREGLFKAAYEQWRAQSIQSARDRMLALTDAALDNLVTAVRKQASLPASQFVLRQMKVGSGG